MKSVNLDRDCFSQRKQERELNEKKRIDIARKFWESRDEDDDDGVDDEGASETAIRRFPTSPVWSSIYCTIRDRRRSKSQSSLNSSACYSVERSSSGTPSASPLSTSAMSSVPSSGRTTPSTPSPGGFAYRIPLEEPANSHVLVDDKEMLPTPRQPMRSKSEDMLAINGQPASPVSAITSRRYQTTCYLEPKAVPVRYSSSVLLRIGSTKKKFTEQVLFKTRLVPLRFSEKVISTRSEQTRIFTSNLTIPIVEPSIIELQPQQFFYPNVRLSNGIELTREEFV